MKAIIHTRYGPPSLLKLGEVEKPTPGEKELLVRVHATTVNRTDCANMRADPFIMRFLNGMFKPKNSILGTEFAGSIEAIGTSVTSFTVGDRIFGFNDSGLSSHAEYLCIPEDGPLGKNAGSSSLHADS